MKSNKKIHTTVKIFIIFTFVVILISIFFPWLSKIIFPNTELGIYNKEFWYNFLINANATILDFFVIGVVIYFLDQRRGKTELTQELLRDLEDFAPHSTVELNLKKVGIIKRLINLGVNKINIQRICIKDVEIRNISIMDSDLTGINLERSKLKNCKFERCNLRSLNLDGGKIKNVIFKKCQIRNMKLIDGTYSALLLEDVDLSNSTFVNSNLSGAIFKNCELSNVTFEKCNLRNVNFKTSKNIDILALSKAENLDYIHADEMILDGLRVLRPDSKYRRK
ncbi:pentapeptide repeat-containing protein [Serratia sp. 22264]|uniref:pentapeptide repeat-containing protein n=1 Tax=Serratia sp. 22264 TaxID=3453897 RepID=UPI003F8327E5